MILMKSQLPTDCGNIYMITSWPQTFFGPKWYPESTQLLPNIMQSRTKPSWMSKFDLIVMITCWSEIEQNMPQLLCAISSFYQ